MKFQSTVGKKSPCNALPCFSSVSSLAPLLAASLVVNCFHSSPSLSPFASRLLSSLVYLGNISFTHPFIQLVFIGPLLCACKGLISGHRGHYCLQHPLPQTKYRPNHFSFRPLNLPFRGLRTRATGHRAGPL